MKNKQFLLLFAIITLLFTSASYPGGNFYLGHTLVEGFREYEKANDGDRDAEYSTSGRYMGYIAGIYDATSYLYCTGDSIQLGQLCSIVGKYLKAHPEQWDELASELVYQALKEAFPLTQKETEK